MSARPFLSLLVEMNLSMTANVKHTADTEQRKLLRNPRCLSAGSDSLYLRFKLTIWAQSYANIPTALPCFNNVIFRHHYVMLKNGRCIETEQHCLCRDPHFNRQNLVLISPPKDYKATAYGTYCKYPAEH